MITIYTSFKKEREQLLWKMAVQCIQYIQIFRSKTIWDEKWWGKLGTVSIYMYRVRNKGKNQEKMHPHHRRWLTRIRYIIVGIFGDGSLHRSGYLWRVQCWLTPNLSVQCTTPCYVRPCYNGISLEWIANESELSRLSSWQYIPIFIEPDVTSYEQQISIIRNHESHNFVFAICKTITTELYDSFVKPVEEGHCSA